MAMCTALMAGDAEVKNGKFRAFVRPDQTAKQRKVDRDLRTELKARKDAGELDIYIRRGKGHLWAKGFVCSKSSHLRVLRGGNDIQAFACGEEFVLLASPEGLQIWAWPDLFHDGPAAPAWQGAALTDEDAKASLPLVPGGYVELHPPFFHELSLSEGVQVRRLALGREHAILLSFTGQVLTWGSGRHGQLGHGGLEMENKARLVEALHGLPILQVAAGGWHSLALSCAGGIYSWGWNEAGQLGLPSKMDFIIDPLDPEKPLQIPERAGEVQVGLECELHRHKHARLGTENHEKEFISIQALPALLDFPHGEDIATIACGSRHSVAIAKCGKLYTWGWDVSVKIDEDLKCLVCLEVFSDPVRLACDHCFCLTCLQQLWHGPTTDESQNRSCPECKRNYQVSPAWRRDPDLQARAVRVRSLLEAASRSQSMSICDHCLDHSAAGVKTCLTCDATLCAKHLRPHLNQPAFRAHTLADVVSGEDGELRKCGRHNELLKLYCQDDRVCVCALCVVIGEHKNHSVITAEEAYEHLQENWAEAQIKVKFQGKEAEGAVNDLLRMQNVAVKAAEEAQKDLEGRYRHLLDLLHEDEQNARCLVQAEEGLARAAAGRQIKRWLARRDDLQSLATVLDRLLSVGDIYEVLKNVRSTDTRVQKVLEGPLPVVEPVNLSTPRITSLCSQAEDLECNLTHLLPRCWTNFCNVTLDPRTAHPCLEISADLQSVSWSRSAHGPSESAERYDTRYNVLGQQLFSAGTHYWEVAVGSKSYWVVGLATRSAPRKGRLDPEATDLGMNKESWALFHCGDIYTASHDRQSVPVTIQAPLRKLGILLDYFAGQIQFYDADRRAILHTFCGTFSQALSPALNPCANRDDTNEDPLVLVHLAKEGR